MSLRQSLIDNGVAPERIDGMFARLEDDDEGVAQNAFREILQSLTPMLLQTLREIVQQERRK